MASYTYTVTATNAGTADSLTIQTGDGLVVDGEWNGFNGFGLKSDSQVPPSGFVLSALGSSNYLYTLSGAADANSYGIYNLYKAYATVTKLTAKKTLTLTINATWHQKLYFNANGGSGAPSEQSWYVWYHTKPDASSRTISSTTPFRSYYTFKGWSTSSSASSASYSPGGSISLSYSKDGTVSTTLYAVWWGEWKSYLAYNANGGSGEPSTQSSTVTQYSQPSSKVFSVSNTAPTKSGKVFKGWSTSSTATAPGFVGGDSISVAYSLYGNTTTLYAVWYTTYYSKLFYNANGGSGAPGTQSTSQTVYSQPSAKSWTVSSTSPTKTNATFKGWSTSSSASSASYVGGNSISVSYSTSSTAGTTLYAVYWTNWKAYLAYNANTGSGAPSTQSATVTQYAQPSDKSFTVSSTTPTLSGYKFLGWSRTQYTPGTGTASYSPGSSVSVAYSAAGNTVTLYAVWKRNAVMKVKTGGNWVDAEVKVKVSGSWVTPTNIYAKKDGVWKEVG